jgi:hypothetical protein
MTSLSRIISRTILSLFVVAGAVIARAAAPLVYLKASTAKVSSFDMTPTWAPDPNPNALIDGNLKTRWASDAKDAQWIVIGFGSSKVVSEVTIRWERAYAESYQLYSSEDGNKWTQLFRQDKGVGGVEKVKVKPTTASFLRLEVLRRANPNWGVSIWEFEAYGLKIRNHDDKPIGEVFPWRASDGVDAASALPTKLPKALPSPGPITLSEFQRGVNLTSWHESELATPAADRTMEWLKSKHVGHIALLVTWFQESPTSTEMGPDNPLGGQTPSDYALAYCINKAHELGMKVLLKPHLDIRDGTYRGDFYPSKQAWFNNYTKFIKRYAAFAHKYNVEAFSVGVELKGATTWEQDDNWRRLIKEVRDEFSGPLVYSANWDEYKNVTFWDALDYIGIDAYFPIADGKKPTLKELTDGWRGHAEDIQQWLVSSKLGKPVLFTELGYPSVEGAGKQPWIELTNVKDRQQQADCFEASFRELTPRDWFKGFYWWHYFPTNTRPVTEDLTIRGKLAEDVMAGWFERMTP